MAKDKFDLPKDISLRAQQLRKKGIKVVVCPTEIIAQMNAADKALNGDSNDAEHDALYAIREWLGDIYEDPDRRSETQYTSHVVMDLTTYLELLEKSSINSDYHFRHVVARGLETLQLTSTEVCREFGINRMTLTRWMQGLAIPLNQMRKPVFEYFKRKAKEKAGEK